MLHTDEIEIMPTASQKRKVAQYAQNGGGMYRMNTQGACYYSYTIFRVKGTRKWDFTGGWDWRSTVSTHFSYVYDMHNNRHMTTEKFIKLRETNQI